MSLYNDLYQEVILDHNKRPRNFGALPDADRQAVGHNPLCGDQVVIYLKTANGVIEDIGFKGSGCAISTASASLMTELIKGKTLQEACRLFDCFHDLVTGKGSADCASGEMQILEVFQGVSEFPVRVKCATLAWHTLRNAINDTMEKTSTEQE